MWETGLRIIERIKDHSGRDHASHMVKYNIETSHTDVNTANFKIIDMNFSNNKRKRKITESLWIKDLRPILMYRRNQYFWSSLSKWLMTLTPTSQLCNVEIIILVVYYLLPWQLLLSFRVLLVYRFYWLYFENG